MIGMFSRVIFWPWASGLVVLLAGLLLARKDLAKARGLDKLVALGPVFMAAGIAVFGAEHLVRPRTMMQIVPAWMPARLFWAYFVGFALLAAAVSFVTGKLVRLSADLLGWMFCLFVLMIHAPNVLAHPKDQSFWVIALRELSFAGGAWALVGGRAALAARFLVGIPMIFFAVEHFLRPQFAPGVPLNKLMPGWIPVRALWGYLTGAFLLFGGVALVALTRWRLAVVCAGLVVTLVTAFLYLPTMLMAKKPLAISEGLNFVADTLLYAGAILCAAQALGSSRRIVKS